jgi:hypothetical protein
MTAPLDLEAHQDVLRRERRAQQELIERFVMDARATDRLTNLLGMLSSEHAGERANAAAAADRLLRECGPTSRGWIGRQVSQQPEPRSIEDIIDFCLSHRRALNDWEHNFLRDMNRRVVNGLSQKQFEKVEAILAKVKSYADVTEA